MRRFVLRILPKGKWGKDATLELLPFASVEGTST